MYSFQEIILLWFYRGCCWVMNTPLVHLLVLNNPKNHNNHQVPAGTTATSLWSLGCEIETWKYNTWATVWNAGSCLRAVFVLHLKSEQQQEETKKNLSKRLTRDSTCVEMFVLWETQKHPRRFYLAFAPGASRKTPRLQALIGQEEGDPVNRKWAALTCWPRLFPHLLPLDSVRGLFPPPSVSLRARRESETVMDWEPATILSHLRWVASKKFRQLGVSAS